MFLFACATLLSCVRATTPPVDRRPAHVDATTDATTDATPIAARAPDALAMRSGRVRFVEALVQHAEANGARYALLMVRCEDIFARGGSDCADLRQLLHYDLRAYGEDGGPARWSQTLTPPPSADMRLVVEGPYVVLRGRHQQWRFTIDRGARL